MSQYTWLVGLTYDDMRNIGFRVRSAHPTHEAAMTAAYALRKEREASGLDSNIVDLNDIDNLDMDDIGDVAVVRFDLTP